MQHDTNQNQVPPQTWWNSQLKLHGLDYRGQRRAKDARALLRLRIAYPRPDEGDIKITKKLSAHERALAKYRSAATTRQPLRIVQNEATPNASSTSSSNHLKRKADGDIGSPSKRIARRNDTARSTTQQLNHSPSGTRQRTEGGGVSDLEPEIIEDDDESGSGC